MNRAPRTVALLTVLCAALAGCGTGGGQPDPSSSSPAEPGASAPQSSAPGSSGPARQPGGGPQRGSTKLATLDVDRFEYQGSCGWEVPATEIELDGGKQVKDSPEVDDVSSEVEDVASRKQVMIGDTEYLLVQLSCEVGDDDVLGAHLIGLVDGRPTDLGIVATGTKITTSTSGGKLRFDTTYRSIGDDEGKATGKASYEIVMAGYTPIRIFDGEQADAIDPAIEKLPAHGYDSGLVSINGYVDSPEESNWLLGLLSGPEQVLAADSLGGGYSGVCLHSTVHTQAGEDLGTTAMAYRGEEDQSGTVIDLEKASKAEPGVRGEVSVPVQQEIAGLLIPANGVVPALATVTTEKAGNPLGDPLVTTKAPADGWLESWRFGAVSGNEYALPFGAFATADGKIAMTGAYFNAPIDQAKAGLGMRPVADPDAVGEAKSCS